MTVDAAEPVGETNQHQQQNEHRGGHTEQYSPSGKEMFRFRRVLFFRFALQRGESCMCIDQRNDELQAGSRILVLRERFLAEMFKNFYFAGFQAVAMGSYANAFRSCSRITRELFGSPTLAATDGSDQRSASKVESASVEDASETVSTGLLKLLSTPATPAPTTPGLTIISITPGDGLPVILPVRPPVRSPIQP